MSILEGDLVGTVHVYIYCLAHSAPDNMHENKVTRIIPISLSGGSCTTLGCAVTRAQNRNLHLDSIGSIVSN